MDPSNQEKSIEENSQETNEKATTTDDQNNSQENQDQQVENFFSESEEDDIQNPYKYEKILSHKINNDGTTSYLVKYPKLSYHHLEWIIESTLQEQAGGNELISSYRVHYPKDSDPPHSPFDPNYLIIEKLITSRQEDDGSKSYLTKWCNLDYQNLTWEPESSIPQNIISDFHKTNQIPDFNEQFSKRKFDYTTWKPLEVPNFTPKKHQIEGLKFITHSFCNEQNVILGDDHGLGSSIQCSMFLKWLTSNESNQGPFLFIATDERIKEWKKSLDMLHVSPVLTFLKPKIQRETIADYELFYPGTNLAKPNIILSNFAIQVHDKLLSEVNWQSIFLDISHFKDNEEMEKCLTNDFFKLFIKFESSFTLLITSVPINDFSLLKNIFCLILKNLAEVTLQFTQNFDESIQSIIYKSSLQSILLKRTFEDIKNVQYPIAEYIVDCGLTEIQLDLMQSVYQKYISYIVGKSNGFLIKTIFNDLNLICTHPYLHEGAEKDILISKKFSDLGEDDNQSAAEFSNKALIESSSKMKFLIKIVNHIKNSKEKNNRLIICSHHEDVLDIIQEYFEYENIFFERIGSSTRGEERSQAIKKFNMICSVDFAVLIYLESGIEEIKLRDAGHVVLIDSDNNPKKDIEYIAKITDCPKINIYRLLCSRSLERLIYDRVLLKFTNPNYDKLSSSGQVVSLLGFGIDLHDSIDYKNDSVQEILERSIRNYYEKTVTFQNSIASFFNANENKKNDPWANFIPYLIKEESFIEKTPNSHISQNSSIFWTKERLITLNEGLVRFGWGRWSSIYNKYIKSLDGASEFEIIGICHILLHILLKKTNNNFPILNYLYQQPLALQASQYEEKFKKENADLYIDLLVKNHDEKLFRIEFMYFINVIVVTCPSPPEEIVVPHIESFFDETWNEDADRYLIYHVYKNGFMRFGNSSISPNLLENRLKCLIETLKKRYLIFHEMKNQNAQFEHLNLVRAVNMLTREEQQKFIQFLIYYGWTTAEDFKEITGSYRTPKELDAIHRVITNFCKGQKDMIYDLAESIPSNIARLVLTREKLLFHIRNSVKEEEVLKPDWPIIQYIVKNGFINLENCEDIRSRFGTNLTTIEYKVSNFLLKYSHNIQLYDSRDLTFNVQKGQIVNYDEMNDSEKMRQSSSPHLKNKISTQVNFECDKDGNPIMPIQITPSLIIVNLGEIVTDRPNFYNNRYIYPKNFASLKMYRSTINPNDKVWYKSSIIDDNTDSPLFRVEMKDDPSIHFDGRAPSKPWLDVLTAANEKKKEFKLPMSKKVTVSGPEYFGLAAPIVQTLIQQMKGADVCLNYNSSIFTPSSSITNISLSQPIEENEGDNKEKEEKKKEETDENENKKEDENDDGMLKIVPRKRDKKISYADSTSSSSNSSDSDDSSEKEEKKGNEDDDKDFNAGDDVDEDESDDNEPFADESYDNDEVEEVEEIEVIEPKKGSSRAPRSNLNNTANHNFNTNVSNNASAFGSGADTADVCIIA